MNDGYLEILNSISSSSPTPGGGSVAALILAHAHSLAAMVARLTLKSEKWSDGHEIANLIVKQSEERIQESILLADKDAASFDAVMVAYRLPKDEDGSTTKADSIREATIGAALVPLETIQAAHNLLNDLLELSRCCNANALTDLAASGELAHSAAKIAQMNVKIYTLYISGDDVDTIDYDTRKLIKDCEQIIIDLRVSYMERLGW